MHYISDDPLSPEEKKAMRLAKRQYNYENIPPPPKRLNFLPIVPTSNEAQVEYDNNTLQKITSDYFKISFPRGALPCLVLNTTTYQQVLNLIKSRYGNYPLNGTFICNAITIVPKPKGSCSLYYQVGQNRANDPVNFKLIASFVADKYERKFSISCPYTDSIYGNHLIFNWFGNDKTGRIVPKVYQTNYELQYQNTNMPWLCPNPLGSYFIDGIIDSIGFHCTFNIDLLNEESNKDRY